MRATEERCRSRSRTSVIKTSSGESSEADIQESEFDRLPKELRFQILKCLYGDSRRDAMICLLVCKEWNLNIRMLVQDMEFGKDLRLSDEATVSLYNLVYPFVRSLHLPNLRSLHLFDADANVGSWRLVFEALGKNCPLLESLRIDKALPLISTRDLRNLHVSLPHLRKLSITLETLEGAAVRSLGLLTNVRELAIGGLSKTVSAQTRHLPLPRSLGRIETLRLEGNLHYFNSMDPAVMTSVRRLHLIVDGTDGLDQFKPLAQLEVLSLDIRVEAIYSGGPHDLWLLQSRADPGWPSCRGGGGIHYCYSLTKLHMHIITKHQLGAIGAMMCLEELCGFLGEDLGDGGLDILQRLPVLRKLHLACPLHLKKFLESYPISTRQLASIAALKQLQVLSLSLDKEVQAVSSLGCLTNLSRLELDGAGLGLATPPEAGQEGGEAAAAEAAPSSTFIFPSVSKLHVQSPTALTAVPAFARPELVQSLELSDCKGLVNLTLLPLLANLANLSIRMCGALGTISLSDTHKRLTSLEVHICENLRTVTSLAPALISASFKYLRSLETIALEASSHLSISWCSSLLVLESLPSNLEKLVVENCDSLRGVPTLPKSVQILELESCHLVYFMNPFSKGGQMTKILIRGGLISPLPPISHLSFLRAVTIIACDLLVTIPSIENLRSLLCLTIYNCNCLVSLPTLPPSLESFHLIGCPELGCLPAVAHPDHAKLRTVHLEDCGILDGAHSLLGIDSLERVVVKNCPRVEREIATWRSRFHQRSLPGRRNHIFYKKGLGSITKLYLSADRHFSSNCWTA